MRLPRLFRRHRDTEHGPVPVYLRPTYDPARTAPDEETVRQVAERYGIDDLDIVRLYAVTEVMVWPGVADGTVNVYEGPWARIAHVLARRDERLGVPIERRIPFRTPIDPFLIQILEDERT